jgi:hypothetical protein
VKSSTNLLNPDTAGRGFVVGAPRSGTTLLINLIAAHPQVAPIYETGFINQLLLFCDAEARRSASSWNSRIYLGIGRYLQTRQSAHDARKFVSKLVSFYRSSNGRTYGKTPDEFFPFGNTCIEYNYCEFVNETERFVKALHDDCAGDPFALGRRYLDRLFAIHCARMGRPLWVNKTPSLVRCVDLLYKMYPESGVVHIVRDGRDVVLSTVARRHGPDNLRDATRRWKEMVLAGRRMKKNHRYQEIRYEELIGDPAKSMAGIFSLLGLEARAAEDLPGLRIYTHREKVWRDAMSEEDRLVFRREAGDLLIALGYEGNDDWV